MGNRNLTAAKVARDDEFYTRRPDIEKEVWQHAAAFAGAAVYCPCDDYRWSQFPAFFADNFAALNLRRVVATHYEPAGTAHKWEFDGKNAVISRLRGGLTGGGDFRSAECVALLRECDIVCTNPPFSLMREFVPLVLECGAELLCVGNMNNVTIDGCFQYIARGKLRLGYGRVGVFDRPSGGTQSVGFAVWWTTLPVVRPPLPLTAKYTAAAYPRYDNFDAINVDRIADIPADYDGVMGVPITFLERHDARQFEIIPQPAPNGSAQKFVGGKGKFVRVLIRRRLL